MERTGKDTEVCQFLRFCPKLYIQQHLAEKNRLISEIMREETEREKGNKDAKLMKTDKTN